MSQTKSQAGFSVKFGDCANTQAKQISKIQLKAHNLKPQIADFQNNVKTKLGASKVPFIMAVLPEYFPVQKVPFFAELWENALKNQVTQKINKEGTNYCMIDFKDPNDNVRLFIKKLSKVFSQLNQTKKQVFAEVEFYDIGKRMTQFKQEQKSLLPWSILFDNCYVKGWVDLSNEFWEMFLALAEKISPKFAESPLLAVLPLMERVSLDLTQIFIQKRFDSVNKLDDNIKIMFIGQANQEMYEKAMEKRDKMRVYISFEDLGYLEISVDMEILAVAQLNQPHN